ncbi:MAG: hypothetical protein IIB60_06710, partial [Planctomycetes bacterium]|nr:hypothetical protein [Planctomycetota bacterium]
SPISVDELKKMSFSDAVAKVTGWKPPQSGDVMLDYHGLLSTFGEYVASNPASFSKQASVLIDAPGSKPAYGDRATSTREVHE